MLLTLRNKEIKCIYKWRLRQLDFSQTKYKLLWTSHQYHVWDFSWHKHHHHSSRPRNVMVTGNMHLHISKAAHSLTAPDQPLVTGPCHCRSPVSDMGDPGPCLSVRNHWPQGNMHIRIRDGQFIIRGLPSHIILIFGIDELFPGHIMLQHVSWNYISDLESGVWFHKMALQRVFKADCIINFSNFQ